MAQTIQFPVSFEFRTTKVHWEQTRGRVIGWRNEQTQTKGTLHLIAEMDAAGETKTAAFPVSRLPKQERERCLATVGKSHADEAVKDICSDLELPYFIHDTKVHLDDAGLRKHSHPADAWHLREEFLRLKADGKAVLSFLNQWGRWMQLRNSVAQAEIADLQDAVRHALTSSAEKWFRSPYSSPPSTNTRSSEFPYFVILTDACEAAIRTTVTMDLLRELKFKTCARPDCGMPFPVTSNHERNYCRQYCAHLESVRRARKSTTERSG